MSRRMLVLASLLAAGCGGGDRERLVLASTTSTVDSGLLEMLGGAFAATRPGHDLVVIGVGTGEALRLGEKGDADILLVHAPAAEEAFMAAGHGLQRAPVMHNDFLLVGPAAHPIDLEGVSQATEVMGRLSSGGVEFVSRGDDSGTHKKELDLWRGAGIAPGGDWYKAVGQGMGESLWVASELQAVTLVDRGTWLAMREKLALAPLLEGDPALVNPYSVITTARARNREGAEQLFRWITGEEAQGLIGTFGVDQWGEVLFHPGSDGR